MFVPLVLIEKPGPPLFPTIRLSTNSARDRRLKLNHERSTPEPKGEMMPPSVALPNTRQPTMRTEVPPNRTAPAVRHRTVDELWYIVDGRAEMWQRSPDGEEHVIDLRPQLSVRVPVGTSFQIRTGSESLRALGVTMPPWPGDDEAEFVEGHWDAS